MDSVPRWHPFPYPIDVQRPLLADVAANYPGRTVEAYVAAIVGNRSYALRRVQ